MTAAERILKAKETRSTQLDLSDCGLTEIPAEVFELTQLQTLILGKNYQQNEPQSQRNRLTFLPYDLTMLKNLQGLGLAFNDFSVFPNEVLRLPKLTTLMLNDNQLAILPSEIGDMEQLHILGLNNNLLAALPNAIGLLRRLKILGVANNYLSDLPDGFQYFQALEQLGLSGNSFTKVPPILFELRALKVLGLANNKLTDFPNDFMQLKQLQRLDLSGNPLPTSLISAAQKGYEGVQKHFFQLANQRKRLLRTIIDGKKEAVERKDLKDRFFRLFNSSYTVCAVCDGAKTLNGMIGHLHMRFENDRCFGCEGRGVADTETEELHKLLDLCNNKKERCRDFIIYLVNEEQSFVRKIQATRHHQQILFEDTVRSIQDIIDRKRQQIDIRVQQFSSYQLFEQKILIALYNLYLHRIAAEERFSQNDYSLDYNDAPINLFSLARSVEMVLSEQEALFDTLIETENQSSIVDIQERLAELQTEIKAIGR